MAEGDEGADGVGVAGVGGFEDGGGAVFADEGEVFGAVVSGGGIHEAALPGVDEVVGGEEDGVVGGGGTDSVDEDGVVVGEGDGVAGGFASGRGEEFGEFLGGEVLVVDEGLGPVGENAAQLFRPAAGVVGLGLESVLGHPSGDGLEALHVFQGLGEVGGVLAGGLLVPAGGNEDADGHDDDGRGDEDFDAGDGDFGRHGSSLVVRRPGWWRVLIVLKSALIRFRDDRWFPDDDWVRRRQALMMTKESLV